MFKPLERIVPVKDGDDDLQDRLKDLVKRTPLPIFWLFGKTQSGKTSIVKFLTGAEEAEIGRGFKPCTPFSREYRFPTEEAPVLVFLDTRGLEEPGYDAAHDLANFDSQAHVVIVTVRVLDHSLEHVLAQLRTIRAAQPSRPIVLALSCLHEAYPQIQHPEAYPFLKDGGVNEDLRASVSEELARSIKVQRERFQGLCDFVVPIDLTPGEEGFKDPDYGGPALKEVLIEALPAAYRQSLLKLEEATHLLQNYFERRALPYIVGYSSLAATAGAIPIPWVDLLILPGIQTRMIYRLARLYGQPMSGHQFMELAGTLGMGMAVRQGIRELVKFIPIFGSIAGAALAGSATFALGKAFCYYYSAVTKGHVPRAEDLKEYYHEQLTLAEKVAQILSGGHHPMQRWRIITLVGLVTIPFLVLLGFGAYHLWWSGLGIWLWWPLSGCLALAYFFAWRWQKGRKLLASEPPPPIHWTPRDLEAWRLVEAIAKKSDQLPPEQMLSLPKYVETAQDLALELARFYHPRAADPVSSLTIPEILSVVELAAHDLHNMVDEYLPGGHLLTIRDLRRFKKVADWYPVVNNIYWLISGVFNPVGTAAKYLAVRGGMSFPWQMLQDNLLVWFFTAYIHRLGNYLIEVNSGRLRVGAERYLELKKQNSAMSANGTLPDPGPAIPVVTFILVGQAKAGKSSLINALLGDQQAFVDVVPATAQITRYELHPKGVPSRFQLLDSVGYGNNGPHDDQLRATENASRKADLILLVLHARNPARQADLDMMQGLQAFFKSHADMHRPPILAVLTHIDLLSPAMEWSPPYDWREPKRPKEQQISEAVAAVHEQLGDFLDGVVPVCTSMGKVYGIDEWLLPALTGLLDQAHAVAFLHCLKAESDTGKVRKVFRQLLASAKGVGGILFPAAQKSA